MKKIILSISLSIFASGILAADMKPYIEAQLGYADLRDVDINSLSGTGFSTSGNIKLKYDSDTTYGFEVGVADVNTNLRLGASYSRAEFDFESGSFSGTATVFGTTYGPASASFTRADLGNDANSLKAEVNLYMLNAYYDFKTDSALTPFLGAGIGMADIKDTKDNELALSLSGGAKYNFDKNLYIGLKGSYVTVNGPTLNVDNADIRLDRVDLAKAEVLLGANF